MRYEDKDLEGKLQEDLEILERLKEEGHKIIEPIQEKSQSFPSSKKENKIARINESFINAFKNNLNIHEYDTTPEEDKKLDPFVRMNDEAKKLVKSYNKNAGEFKIGFIITITTISLGIIVALLFLK